MTEYTVFFSLNGKTKFVRPQSVSIESKPKIKPIKNKTLYIQTEEMVNAYNKKLSFHFNHFMKPLTKKDSINSYTPEMYKKKPKIKKKVLKTTKNRDAYNDFLSAMRNDFRKKYLRTEQLDAIKQNKKATTKEEFRSKIAIEFGKQLPRQPLFELEKSRKRNIFYDGFNEKQQKKSKKSNGENVDDRRMQCIYNKGKSHLCHQIKIGGQLRYPYFINEAANLKKEMFDYFYVDY